MKFLYIFLACYFISFVIAWLLAAKRMARKARILKNNGLPDNKIDEFYRTMSKPTWIMSIWYYVSYWHAFGCCGFNNLRAHFLAFDM